MDQCTLQVVVQGENRPRSKKSEVLPRIVINRAEFRSLIFSTIGPNCTCKLVVGGKGSSR